MLSYRAEVYQAMGLSYVFIGVINMVYTSSILNHADINLHKTADFIRVPVELKKRKNL